MFMQEKSADISCENLTEALAKIDDVGRLAVVAIMEAMIAGKSNEEAYNAGNKFLIADGREPISFPK